jgi:DNA helicase II / ATP-dependent DNA helicase PcrA
VKPLAEITSDDKWSGEHSDVKTLTLEHHMAARRGRFSDFFEPLYQVKKFKTGLLDGKLSGIPFFSQQVLPLVKALQSGNRFAVTQIVKNSPIMRHDTLRDSKSPLEDLRTADAFVQSLFSLWGNDSDPLLINSLKAVAASGLFAIPDVFAPIVSRADSPDEEEDSAENSDNDPAIDAWNKALSAPFSQLQSYVEYVSDRSPFGTHQGIKGLQFPRVMVILDDNEARGFMFSYDKLFGAKAPSSTDTKNAEDGKETSIDRTRRLFYVTCSRTQSSLAVVVYTKEKDKIRDHLRELLWFEDEEIIEWQSYE